MDYRREIDGLRAVAILPVVLFHAGLGLFPGGYVGVDVFFVISGYLITSIILSDLRAGAFSLANFYARRIRRILPALFLVLATSTCLAVLWLLPSDLVHFFKSVSFTAIFLSNYRFYRVKDYFAPEAELQPLVHTWSLSIEEQYYLVFPLVILVLYRWRKSTIAPAILVVGAASLVFAQKTLASDPSAAFFLTPYRVWELMIGSLLAAAVHQGRVAVRPSETFAVLGLTLILAAASLFSDATPFPAAYALIPTLGAALIILFATPQTWVGQVLGSRPMVTIGLISYSAYLWHQPLFAFAKLRFASSLKPTVMLLLCVGVFILAGVTWYLVEQPARRARFLSTKALFALAAAVTLGFLALGRAGETIDQFKLRGEAYAHIEHVLRANNGLDRVCRDDGWALPQCRTADAPEIAVWGDSYAMHLVQALASVEPRPGVIQATRGACPPILGAAPYSSKRPASWSRQCMRHNESVLQLIKQYPSVRYVVMSSFFTTLTAPGSRLLLRDNTTRAATEATFEAFLTTIGQLKAEGVTPVIIAPPPQNGLNHGRCRASVLLFGSTDQCAFPLEQAEAEQKHERALLRRLEAQGARVIWLDGAICPGGVCTAGRGDVTIYKDTGHLTVEGSLWLGREMQLPTLVRKGAGP